MKKFLLPLCLAVLSCKHIRQPTSNVKQIYTGSSIDAVLVNSALVNAPEECRFHVINFFTNSLTEGLVRNGAMQGLGTDNPAGKKMIADSLYFQMLRVVSIADWEMTQTIQDARVSACLIDNLSVNFGVLPLRYTSSLPRPFASEVSKVEKAAAVINPALGEFMVGEIDGMENPLVWPKQSSLPTDYQEALRAGVMDKIRFANSANSPGISALEKAKAMAASYTPYNISLNAKLLAGRPQDSRFFIEAYLPPFYELESPDENRFETWRLKPGLKMTALPKEVDISIAKLTHVGYMTERESAQNPVIKMQMFRDFNDANRLRTRFVFGRIDPNGMENGSIPMDFKNYRDALYIRFYPNMAILPKDNSIVRGFKSQFNELANGFKVDARIHQLTLNLERKQTGDNAAGLMLRPKFSLKDSDISFRMHRYTKDEAEVRKLKAVGFTCEGNGEVDCYQDFGAYTQLVEFVNKNDQGLAQGRLGTAVADKFKGWVNAVIRQNVKWVIDWNIATIEEAIDAQFIQIFEELVANQDANNQKIRARLEQALFSPE